jgi:predicted alternative tryptophan synthase beta-subunit
MVAILIICVAFGSMLSAVDVDANDVFKQSNMAAKHGGVVPAPDDLVTWRMCMEGIQESQREMRQETDEKLDAIKQLITASAIHTRNV